MPGVPIQSPIMIGLIQITEPMLAFTTVPYAAGLLQAYVQAHAKDPHRYLFLLPQFERQPIEEAARGLQMASVAGFSTYVWNMQYSLVLAQRLKELNPEVLIVFGGPQVPDRAEDFLRSHPFIDVCVHGEGEIPFLQLLESLPAKDWAKVEGISRIDAHGAFHTAPRPARIQQLDTVPSPYLSGVFDPLLSRLRRRWILLWETNRGCPYSCTFCDWGSAVAVKLNRFGMERLEAEIDWFARKRTEVVYTIDSNYGLLPRDLELTRRMVEARQTQGYPRILYTQSAKNVTERIYAVQKMLVDAGMNLSATLSVQSVAPAPLEAIKRSNISLETYAELQRRLRKDGVPTYTDYLVGLPGETFESFITGVGTVIANGQHRELRLHNTYILPNAELNDPAYRQQYGIESVMIRFLSHMQPAEPLPWQEYQEMMVACKSYSREDWARMRVFAWLATLLYYSQALKLPMMLLHQLADLPYEQQLMAFLGELPPDLPVLNQLGDFLRRRATDMLAGGPELVAGPASQGQEVWMTTDYYACALLLESPKLGDFFAECRRVLEPLARSLPQGLLDDALTVSEAMFRCQQLQQPVTELQLGYNLAECYNQVLAGEPLTLKRQPTRLEVRRRLGDYELSEWPLEAAV